MAAIFIALVAVQAGLAAAPVAEKAGDRVPQAMTYEPLVLMFNDATALSPFSYHISINRFFSITGLTSLSNRSTPKYWASDLGIGLGLEFWLFSSGPFEGLFFSKRFEAQNTWVFSEPSNDARAGSVGGFSLNQDFLTGYQWSWSHYLIGTHVMLDDLKPPRGVCLSIGYAWSSPKF